MDSSEDHRPPAKHPIRVVSQRTGLKADLIRAWERRYGAIKPRRSAGRHRFYTDEDIERLLLLRQATSSARSISQLAQLSDDQLRELIEEDRQAQLAGPFEPTPAAGATLPPSVGRTPPPRPAQPAPRDGSAEATPLAGALEAVARLDSADLTGRLDEATLRLGYSRTLTELVEPLLDAVRRLRDDGRLREMHWRFTACEVRAFVQTLMRRAPLDPDAPRVIVATPPGQKRELGALMMAAHTAGDGWRGIYLGADLPTEEIAAACQAAGALAVILDLSFPKDDPELGPRLWDLRRRLGPGLPLLVGGPALDGYVDYLQSRAGLAERRSVDSAGRDAAGFDSGALETPGALETMASAVPVQNPGELKTLLMQLRARHRQASSAAATSAPSRADAEPLPTVGVRELPLSAAARREWALDASLISEHGGLRVSTLRAVRRLVHRLNQAPRIREQSAAPFYAGQIKAAALIYELSSRLLHERARRSPGFLDDLLDTVRFEVQSVGPLLRRFAELFPQNRLGVGDPRAQGPGDGELLLRLFLLRLMNRNPACEGARRLFDDRELASSAAYGELEECLRRSLAGRTAGGGADSLLEALTSARDAAPESLPDQLQHWLEHYPALGEDLRDRLWICLDVLHEEQAPSWEELRDRPVRTQGWALDTGAGAPRGDGGRAPVRRPDRPWMRELVLLSKNVLVWLSQLSDAYEQEIRTLDQVPDRELDRLAELGITGLWLVGIWKRSPASRKIKHLLGREQAVASAYAVDAYEIAPELGGEEAKERLEARAAERGIRLACDIVPNHMGLDGRWVIEHPERFIQVAERPFPSYTFNGPDLSSDSRVALYLEDHYEDQSDAAVVFQRVDRATGEVRFLYHGNDGTSLPWNDTAQLDYTREDVRRALVEQIVRLAKSYPIIRLDAAMTLIRDHFQRLWFPEPGKGGAVPSRAEHHVTREEFLRRMPRELWSEVLERLEQEAPDTLLIAEGFWYTESYFVRELGMHRVYNSAFRHLLQERQNAQLVDGLKKSLASDPDALDCFVNFLTNPDEAAAAGHFGSGERYFAFCTLLVTLPGLPLLGHGQLEGLTEKYSMDAERPETEETPDEEVLEQHRRRIVPLMKERSLYARGRTLRLLDPERAEDQVVAFVNGVEGDRRLVVVNNSDEPASTRLHHGAPFRDGSSLSTRTLAQALDLPSSGSVALYSLQDERRWRLEGEEAHRRGWQVELEPWETRVLKAELETDS